MDLLKRKISGATMLESLLAMTIVLLSVALASGIYSGLNGQAKGYKSFLLFNKCEQIFNEIEKGSLVESISDNQYSFAITFEDYLQASTLKQLSIKVTNLESGKTVLNYRRLLPDDPKHVKY